MSASRHDSAALWSIKLKVLSSLEDTDYGTVHCGDQKVKLRNCRHPNAHGRSQQCAWHVALIYIYVLELVLSAAKGKSWSCREMLLRSYTPLCASKPILWRNFCFSVRTLIAHLASPGALINQVSKYRILYSLLLWLLHMLHWVHFTWNTLHAHSNNRAEECSRRDPMFATVIYIDKWRHSNYTERFKTGQCMCLRTVIAQTQIVSAALLTSLQCPHFVGTFL